MVYNYKTLNFLLQYFRFDDVDMSLYEDHIEYIMKEFPFTHYSLPKGTLLYRCRPYESRSSSSHELGEKEFFKQEEKLSYRKRQYMDEEAKSSLGRCHVLGNETFYGSFIHFSKENRGIWHDSEHLKSAHKTMFLEANKPDGYNNSPKEFYGVGVWRLRGEMSFPYIPPSEKHLTQSQTAKELMRKLWDDNPLLKKDGDRRRFYEIIANEFTKDMSGRPNQEYGISALLSQHLLRKESIGGVIYLSVANGLEGLNIALDSKVFTKENFEFVGAEIWKGEKHGNKLSYELQSKAEYVQGQDLIYKPSSRGYQLRLIL